MSKVEKLILDSDSDHFCFYHFLIGCIGAEILTAKVRRKSVKSWGTPIFLLTPIFCDFLAWQACTSRPGQCTRKPSHINWPAGCSQSLRNYMRRRQQLQEVNTSVVREEPATVDFTGPKQYGDASLDLYIIFVCDRDSCWGSPSVPITHNSVLQLLIRKIRPDEKIFRKSVSKIKQKKDGWGMLVW